MTRLPRLALVLALCVPAALPATGTAAVPSYPSVTKVSPLKLGVGDTLTVRGKGFRAGHGRTTVVLKRAGGRAVFLKADTATKTRVSVVLPGKLLTSLVQKGGKPATTRFRVRVLTGRLGKAYTSVKGSPLIGPKPLASKVAANDCDGDGVSNAKDLDDDNDLLRDTLESALRTDPCKRDTDGDGMSDGWEYESALDYNGRAKPSPNKRPYPNALDGKDGGIDADGDGLTNAQEYAAWATFGGGKLPLTYSGGDPATGGKAPPSAGNDWADRDRNGFLSDNERDADGDGLPNQEEDLVDGYPEPKTPVDARGRTLGIFSVAHIERSDVRAVVDNVPLYGTLPQTHKVLPLNWLDPDSDGDTIKDGADDSDGDGDSNRDELVAEIGGSGPSEELPINACAPNLDARLCIVGDDDIDNDGRPNRSDDDDDGDRLGDAVERSLGLNPYKADTDGDGAGDGFEYYSAKDLNGAALPFPGKRPYPNALDPSDGVIDHDGDGLSLVNEFRAWVYTGSPLPLSYSDGNQATGGGAIDGLKDVDRDGVTNYSEVSGPLSGPAFWTAWVKDNNQGCPGGGSYVESPYPGPKYTGLDFVDPDSDGDGVLDGADDIDHDGLTNLEESREYVGPNGSALVRRPDWCSVYVSVGPGTSGHNVPTDPAVDNPGTDRYARVDPFNPCKPVYSEACHKFVPLGYYVKGDQYVEDWAGAKPNR